MSFLDLFVSSKRAAKDEMFIAFMNARPAGMNPAPEVKRSWKRALKPLPEETLARTAHLLRTDPSMFSAVVNILELTRPNERDSKLIRTIDNLDHARALGWTHSGLAAEFIAKSFKGYRTISRLNSSTL